MKQKIPHSPFTTRLSGSAKETELRLRNIFQWKKKRPPVIAFVAAILVIAFCGSLVGFRTTAPEEPPQDDLITETTPSADTPITENTQSENGPTQENAADISAVQPETAHDWAGTGYLYYSAALEASVEFPPEWGSLLHVYDYENTVRIDTLVGWDEAAPDNGRMATIYKFTREDWDTQSGAYQKGMFEGGPTVQIIAEDENYVYILKRYGGLIGFKTLNDPGFNEYKTIDEALKNYELEIYPDNLSRPSSPMVQNYPTESQAQQGSFNLARQPVLDYLQQEYLHSPVYYLGEEPSAPQEGDWRVDYVSYQGETRLYETIGRAYDLSFSTYSSSQWNQNSSRCLVLSFSIDGTLNGIEGISRVTTESMPAEYIILQVANNLMDLQVSLWRDGYAWPAGPGNRVQFHREVYDGPETIEVLENWEPIYYEGDYWAMHSWTGFEALCYHHSDTGTYNINRIDTTRTDLRTYRGIRVGDSREDVIAAYPELKSGDYWGQYPGQDILWYCDDPNDFGAALIFFFEDDTVSRIVLNNMFN